MTKIISALCVSLNVLLACPVNAKEYLVLATCGIGIKHAFYREHNLAFAKAKAIQNCGECCRITEVKDSSFKGWCIAVAAAPLPPLEDYTGSVTSRGYDLWRRKKEDRETHGATVTHFSWFSRAEAERQALSFCKEEEKSRGHNANLCAVIDVECIQ